MPQYKILNLFKDMATVTGRISDYTGPNAIDGYNPDDLKIYLETQYNKDTWSQALQTDIDENKDAVHTAKTIEQYSVYSAGILVAVFSSFSQANLVDEKTAKAFVLTSTLLAIALMLVKAICDPVASSAANANMRLQAVKKYAEAKGIPGQPTWVETSLGGVGRLQAQQEQRPLLADLPHTPYNTV